MNRFDSLDVPLNDTQSGSLNGQLARGTHESTDVVTLLQRLEDEFPPRPAGRTKDEDPHVEDPLESSHVENQRRANRTPIEDGHGARGPSALN
jgi:hypothetical protein